MFSINCLAQKSAQSENLTEKSIYIYVKNVLLIDSGSGGVNILKECVRVAGGCNFLLFCDNKNLPYGSKSKEQLQSITLQNLRNIQRFFKFEIVVFACNTLSCTCLEIARATFPDVVFIGTVPAVKPALEKFEESDILVLATQATIKHNTLINKHPHLMTKSLPNLASQIDENLDNLQVLQASLQAELESFQPKAVVLGCTHYQGVQFLMEKIFEDAQFFDSANGVARRLKHFVGEGDNSYQVQIMVSKQDELLQKFWWWFWKE